MRKTTEKETRTPRALVEPQSTPPKAKKNIKHTQRHTGAGTALVRKNFKSSDNTATRGGYFSH
jgi:hypothetical protein